MSGLRCGGERFGHPVELERYRRYLREAEVERLIREIRPRPDRAEETTGRPAGLFRRVLRWLATS